MPHNDETRQLSRPRSFLRGACGLVITLIAVFATDAQTSGSESVIQFIEGRISYEDGRVRQRGKFRAAIIFNVKSGRDFVSFINSNQALGPGLVPTTIEVVNEQELKGLMIGAPIYPKGQKVTLAFSNQPLSVYSRYNRVEFDGRIPKDMPLGRYVLRVRLTYQSCADRGCSDTEVRQIAIPFEIVEPSAQVYWDNYYFHRIKTSDYLLMPVRLIKEVGCSIKSCG